MTDTDVHILQSSIHYNTQHQRNGIDRNDDDVVYDMNNYDTASIFEEHEPSNVEQFEDYSYGDTLDIDDHSATWSDGFDDEYDVTIMDIDGYDSDNSFIPSSHSTHWSSSSSSSSSSLSSLLSSSSSSASFNLPQYCPPMFAKKPRHFSAIFKLQSQLNNLFDNNKASITMYYEMIRLFNDYIASSEFSQFAELQPCQQFVASCEKMFGIEAMKPEYAQVRMTNDSLVSVPVFDAKAMILSLLHDPTIMRKENFAKGYNIFTGKEWKDEECNNKYGEIHTGGAWKPALRQYCGNDRVYMPIALVLFGDKSHTDLHGTLSVEPVTFTLSLFNQSARNLPQFWWLLGYIPNLTAGKGEADRTSAKDKIQNEHICISRVLKSLREIYDAGGIRTTVMGRDVHIKVWIHYIIGDTEGNNKWLGHYPGNNCGVVRPYRDCQCCFADMAKPIPNCVYTTLREMEICRETMGRNTNEGGIQGNIPLSH